MQAEQHDHLGGGLQVVDVRQLAACGAIRGYYSIWRSAQNARRTHLRKVALEVDIAPRQDPRHDPRLRVEGLELGLQLKEALEVLLLVVLHDGSVDVRVVLPQFSALVPLLLVRARFARSVLVVAQAPPSRAL